MAFDGGYPGGKPFQTLSGFLPPQREIKSTDDFASWARDLENRRAAYEKRVRDIQRGDVSKIDIEIAACIDDIKRILSSRRGS